jgi:hypothetical protein
MTSCEEPFDPQLKPSEQRLLVVDGMISNEAPPYVVQLSYSSDLKDPRFIPATEFQVWVQDDQGEIIPFIQSSPGTYTSAADGPAGIPGRTYQLMLQSYDGRQYVSAPETLPLPVAIQSVDYMVETIEPNNLPYSMTGLQFYLTTGQAPADSSYFVWQLTETYKYQADFKLNYLYSGGLHLVFNPDSLRTCYTTQLVEELFLFDASQQSVPQAVNFPLNFVSTETRALTYRYSLLARQFSITATAFDFYRLVREQNSSASALFTRQPFQIKGNITSVDDADETVLGLFMAASVTEKRVFVTPPFQYLEWHYPLCDFYDYDAYKFIWTYTSEAWPLMVTRGPDGLALPSTWCIDCRQQGGTLEKPDFWVDN